MPISVLAKTKNNFTAETQKAFTGMSMMALYKIAWESQRFWEKECRIYGGISFPKQMVDLVWYPSDKLFSPTGILIAGFNMERDLAGEPTSSVRCRARGSSTPHDRRSISCIRESLRC